MPSAVPIIYVNFIPTSVSTIQNTACDRKYINNDLQQGGTFNNYLNVIAWDGMNAGFYYNFENNPYSGTITLPVNSKSVDICILTSNPTITSYPESTNPKIAVVYCVGNVYHFAVYYWKITAFNLAFDAVLPVSTNGAIIASPKISIDCSINGDYVILANSTNGKFSVFTGTTFSNFANGVNAIPYTVSYNFASAILGNSADVCLNFMPFAPTSPNGGNYATNFHITYLENSTGNLKHISVPFSYINNSTFVPTINTILNKGTNNAIAIPTIASPFRNPLYNFCTLNTNQDVYSIKYVLIDNLGVYKSYLYNKNSNGSDVYRWLNDNAFITGVGGFPYKVQSITYTIKENFPTVSANVLNNPCKSLIMTFMLNAENIGIKVNTDGTLYGSNNYYGIKNPDDFNAISANGKQSENGIIVCGSNFFSGNNTDRIGYKIVYQNASTLRQTKEIEEDNNVKSIEIFPNPFKNKSKININNFNENEEISYKLYDIMGRIIFKNTIVVSNAIFDLKTKINNLQTGNYILKFQANNFNQVIKITKE